MVAGAEKGREGEIRKVEADHVQVGRGGKGSRKKQKGKS